MSNQTQQPPIKLSICIPTYNRQHLLAQTLDSLRWTLNTSITIEIIVSDNASEDETESVARQKAKEFPLFRYIRQTRNVGAGKNHVAALRLARGKYSVRLADDDRLIPETLLAEIAYLDEHDDIVASHAPWQLWSDVTHSECGRLYHIDEPVSFGKAQSAELFNYIIARHIFPEIPIYRTAIYWKTCFECHYVTSPFVMDFRALEYGKIRFQPNPFCLVIIQTPIKSINNRKAGVTAILTNLDQYRGALELIASQAMSNRGMSTFNVGNRAEVLDIINDFISKRIRVAARIAQAQKDYIGAFEFLQRGLLWEKNEAERANIHQLLDDVKTGAIYQSMVELFNCLTKTDYLVLCELHNPDDIQASFRQLAPDLPTVIHSLPTALEAMDRENCIYFTGMESVRLALTAIGIEYGRVVVTSDLLIMFTSPHKQT